MAKGPSPRRASIGNCNFLWPRHRVLGTGREQPYLVPTADIVLQMS